jgi:MerR family redox-sensitive transcriptional activator SoxR
VREIEAELAHLPQGRAPTQKDWQAISERIRDRLDERILMLQRTRDRLDGCIGCGCLSLQNCALYNPGDVAGDGGAGPRYLLGEDPPGGVARPSPLAGEGGPQAAGLRG